ncbi:MAG: HmuY family protein [Vicingaceae bacterium]
MDLKTILMFIAMGALAACMKEEIPVNPIPRGVVKTDQIAMTSSYNFQIYYDLETSSVVGQHDKSSWDLGFNCTAEGWQIILNTAKLMAATNSNIRAWKDLKDTNSITGWRWDAMSGNLDSTAIGSWMDTGLIYIIDRGYNSKGKRQGFAKLMVDEVDENHFEFRFSNLEDENSQSYEIIKDAEVNFVYFSFDNQGSQLWLEPNKEVWDLVFTQYTNVFFEGTFPYLVSGVLHNPYKCLAIEDSLVGFENIERSDAQRMKLKADIDIPGYDWKRYDFDEGRYITDPNRTYVIQTFQGYYFKLRFTDFYNSNGETGFPTFEFQYL